MANQTTRTNLKGLDRSEYLGKSIRTHMTMTSSKLTAFFSGLPPKAEGEAPWPDWTNVQEANLFKLDLATNEAHQASEAHKDAKLVVKQITTRRDDLVPQLGSRYRSLRGSIRSTYSLESLALVGLEDPFMRAYLAARAQCRTVASRLRAPDLLDQIGDPQADQSHLDFDKIASGLDTELEGFETILGDLTEARKRRDEALIAKQTAEKRLNATLANIARVQEGYYRMAGLEELADRIRLTIPRPSKKPVEPPPDGDTTNPNPADETEVLTT